MHNETYLRKVLPFLKEDYFDNTAHRTVLNSVVHHVNTYNSLPNKSALKIALDYVPTLNEETYKSCVDFIENLSFDDKTDEKWLLDKTEEFCQEKAIYNAIRKSILIIDGQDKLLDKGSIPTLLEEALAISFDPNVGHDYSIDAEERYDFYNAIENKIKFDLEYFNRITKGGLSRKTLSVILASTGVGKTMFMTHMASAAFMMGLKVLYITNEMAEERIAERIDSNLMDVELDTLAGMDRTTYLKKIDRINSRTNGRLYVKEYPTSTANTNHFRHLLHELRLKKNFVPDIIFVDYLNICASSRLKPSSNVGSYTYIKAIAEELRGLAVEFNVPVITATQTTRNGYKNSDIDLSDTSESFGVPATADFMFALTSTDELEALNQLMVTQLKNRWGSITSPSRFVIGVDRARMKLYDLEDSAQGDIIGGPVMDRTTTGERLNSESTSFGKRKITGLQ